MNTMFLLADTGSQTPSGFAGFFAQYGMIIMLVLMFVAMYFLMIRPQKKKLQRHEAALNSITKGSKVVIGGILGTVSKVGDNNELTVKIADNTEITVIRGYISQVLEEEK